METRLEELSEKHPRYGYRRVAALMRRPGWAVGNRQVPRWRRAAGLRVPATKRKQTCRGASTGLPTAATRRGHVWTWDFGADATVGGGTLRMLTILDKYPCECPVLRADRRLGSRDVLQWLQRAIEEHGAPEFLGRNNGAEFMARVVQTWLRENGIKTIYFEPGSQWQNGFVESFHGRLRDECPNRELLWTLSEARVVVKDFRQEYDHRGRHSRLRYLSPRVFAKLGCPSPSSVGLRPPSAGDGQPRVEQ